ncbi:MAG: polysaccharide deacetylase family protein [Candidatus Hodarchaeota archaeon]
MKEKTFIEKLGFNNNDKVVIFHIDDMGSSHAANVAAFECLDFGVMSCGSAIVPSPWFLEVAEICRNNPNYDVGVHLALTSEYNLYRWRPLSTVDPLSGLLDDEGFMWKTIERVGVNVTSEIAEAELRAQIEFALACGIDVTHIDSHMSCMLIPKFSQIYMRLANEFKIIPLFPKITREFLAANNLKEYFDFFKESIHQFKELGFPQVDHVIQDTGTTEENYIEYYCNHFAKIKPGLTHFLIHPAKMSPELTAIMDTSPHVEGGAMKRDQDYKSFIDPRIKDCVEKYDLKIIGYRKIRDYLWHT